jgi:hypothetical protein
MKGIHHVLSYIVIKNAHAFSLISFIAQLITQWIPSAWHGAYSTAGAF